MAGRLFGKSLRGRSFRGQDLTGTDFSDTDIQGADFTGAILNGANFSGARAGLRQHWIAIAVIVSLYSGLFTGFVAAWISSFPTSQDPSDVVAGAIVLAELAIFLIVARCEGFIKAFGIVVSILASFSTLAGGLSVAFNQVHVADITLSTATTSVVVIAAAFAVTIFLAATIAAVGRVAIVVAWVSAIMGAIMIPAAATSEVATNIARVGAGGFVLAVGIAVCLVLLCADIAQLSLAESEKHRFIRDIAISSAAIVGTRFREADLTDANFAQATLKNTDLRNANLTQTNFHTAKQLERARVGNTILSDSIVRALVVTHRGANKSYAKRNLKGANLAGADLRDADLTDTDISNATFAAAWLERANLTRTQAVGTYFRQARLTGACLEAWNIDSTTQLEGVLCDYVYLLNYQRERRPSNGQFAADEFSKLFQEVLSTVDLIFRNGINWKAFTYSFNQLQLENEDIALSIQSIENKGDGVIVVRVSAPPQVDKAKLHAEFTQNYTIALNAIEEKYRTELMGKEAQLTLYRQQQTYLQNLVHTLASHPKPVSATNGKLVVLKVGQGSLSTGFSVTVQIGEEGALPMVEAIGELAPAPQLATIYSKWQTTYRRSLQAGARLDVPEAQITNVSRQQVLQDCRAAAQQLQYHLNVWLNSTPFRPVKEQLLEQLLPSESIRIVLQTDDWQLRRLPLQLWDFFEHYPKSELSLSASTYKRVEQLTPLPATLKILAVLGNTTGIDLQQDQALLGQLPNAEVSFLVEPQRQELNDQLWAQPWDILFFSGHSSSHEQCETGYIYINRRDRLTISQLKHSLRKAISQGLTLAIFNSCDGLGLATNLADLHIPQTVVMREPIPDPVAHEFLKNFLTGFSRHTPLYQAVREAREKLQGLEDQFPYATWLPVICQNPTDVPLTRYHN